MRQLGSSVPETPLRRRAASIGVAAVLLVSTALTFVGPSGLLAADSAGDTPTGQVPEPPEPAADSPVEVDHSERIVVTATGNETPSGEVASTLTVVTAADARRRGHQTVAEALIEVPGVDVRRNGGLGNSAAIFIRGANPEHTLVLVDGIEVMDPSTPNRAAFIDHLTLDGVRSIEVLRGAQSTLYGSDAIGGVVNVITDRGEGRPGLDGFFEAGDYSTLRGRLASSGEVGRMAYSINASHVDADGFSATAGGVERDPYRNSSLAGRFTLEASDAADVDVVVRHVVGEVDFDGSLAAEEDHRIDSRQTLVKVEPTWSLADGRWRQRLALRAASHHRDTRGDFPSVATGETAGVEWRHDLRMVDGHVLSFGVAGDWEAGEFGAFDDSARTLSLFAQDQVRFDTGTFGSIGVRFDDHSAFGSQATYRVALGHRLKGSGTIVRASVGTGFKAPSLFQLYHPFYGGNPDLQPERSVGFDLGVERRIGAVRLGATFFHNRIDELIVGLFDPTTFTSQYLNLGEAVTRGGETYAELDLRDGLDVRLSYTYTGSEAKRSPPGSGLVEGASLLRRPRHKANVDARQAFASGRGVATLTAWYVGRRHDIDPVTFQTVDADAYLVATVGATFRLSEALTLSARVENVMDETYEDVLGFNTPDRSGYVGVRVGF